MPGPFFAEYLVVQLGLNESDGGWGRIAIDEGIKTSN
jgi:hypothetical protein